MDNADKGFADLGLPLHEFIRIRTPDNQAPPPTTVTSTLSDNQVPSPTTAPVHDHSKLDPSALARIQMDEPSALIPSGSLSEYADNVKTEIRVFDVILNPLLTWAKGAFESEEGVYMS